ncbi:WYL domain-containing protein [Streptomyces pseudogriseolus]|uniref:WYL domain-containing protein n=1 Tax=Streptomyces pseudogriseolus TaxID=36817 RepID=UPI003FA30607
MARRISEARRLALMLRAAQASKPVEIVYECGKDGETERRVIEIHDAYTTKDGDWVFSAYCRLRDEKRTFRLDRITSHRTLRLAWKGPTPRVTPMFSVQGTPTKTAFEPKPRTYTADGLLASIRKKIAAARTAA